jgi:uncharacterized membrane protein YhiD involved in acid resistance
VTKPKNFKTTALGVATILTAISSAVMAFLDGDPATNFDIAAVIAAVTAGIGLILAKDGSEKA